MVENAAGMPVSILLLEDDPLDAELALTRLRKANLQPEVMLCRDRKSFEDALTSRPYQLILADYALPDFDGIAALAMTREKLPHIPFIFISGRVGEEVAIDTLQRGATDYVLKHRLERLVPAVLRALKEAEEHATRMQAEAMFRQSELRFRHVIDAIPQKIWVANPRGELLYSNQAWRDSAPPGITRWCDPEFFDEEGYRACTNQWHAALKTKDPFTMEVRLQRRSDCSFRWHLLRMASMPPNPDGGEEELWLGSATDLQDQKMNEEALRTAEKLSVTGRMAAAIAHEINNPLESLTNLLFLVRLESEEKTRALSFLDMADSELQRISSITKQTLQFHRDPSTPVNIDAQQILDEVLRLFAARLASKNIKLTFEVRPGILFQAIKGEIRQVLINLVNNAIDAVGQSGTIELEAEIELRVEPMVNIRVHDNGSGITEEQAERLFQPFYSTKGALGTGLGLWVSKGIVEKHGGTLRLGSSREGGSPRTTASLTLPSKAQRELIDSKRAPNA